MFIKTMRTLIYLLVFCIALKEATIMYSDEILSMEKIETSVGTYTVPNGYYEENIENNFKVKGAYKNGILDGQVEIRDKEGNLIYLGFVSDGVYAGYGRLYYYEKLIYDGRFKNGLYSGYGIEYKYDDNDNLLWTYKGQFKNGQKNGYGVLEIAGLITSGNFISDTFDGKYYATTMPIVPDLVSLMMEPNYNYKYEKDYNSTYDKLKEVNKVIKNKIISLKDYIIKIYNNISNDTKYVIKIQNDNVIRENENKKENQIKIENKSVQNDTKITRNEFANILRDFVTELNLKNISITESQIFNGDGKGDLMLEKDITYEEALVVLNRMIKIIKESENDDITTDTENMTENINSNLWSKESIKEMKNLSLIEFSEDFDYKESCNKDELYKILNKLKEMFEE